MDCKWINKISVQHIFSPGSMLILYFSDFTWIHLIKAVLSITHTWRAPLHCLVTLRGLNWLIMSEKEEQNPTYLYWCLSLLCCKRPDFSDLCWSHKLFYLRNEESPLLNKLLARGRDSRLKFLCQGDAVGQICWLALTVFVFAAPVFFWNIFIKKYNWPLEKKKKSPSFGFVIP